MQLEFFPVIFPDGRLIEVRSRSSELYDSIEEHIGSPFTVAPLTEELALFVNDEGLYNGMTLNVPLALSYGAVICGPIMMIGSADRHGNTTLPIVEEEDWGVIKAICENLTIANGHVTANREAGFTITEINDVEEFFRGE
jgi:hypothetical protein